MQLIAHHIHLWIIDLSISLEQERDLFATLSNEECERANRLLSPLHRLRFIAAHGALRQILSRYLETLPQNIHFVYSEHKKPSLAPPNELALQFNLSHSDQLAICALTLHHAVGVDIEKMKISYNPALAKRFFNPREYEDLLNLSKEERTQGFYRLWSRKEALIKALGKGLSQSLSSFSVSVHNVRETVSLENKNWVLIPLTIHAEYQSALATDQEVKEISFFHHQY